MLTLGGRIREKDKADSKDILKLPASRLVETWSDGFCAASGAQPSHTNRGWQGTCSSRQRSIRFHAKSDGGKGTGI